MDAPSAHVRRHVLTHSRARWENDSARHCRRHKQSTRATSTPNTHSRARRVDARVAPAITCTTTRHLCAAVTTQLDRCGCDVWHTRRPPRTPPPHVQINHDHRADHCTCADVLWVSRALWRWCWCGATGACQMHRQHTSLRKTHAHPPHTHEHSAHHVHHTAELTTIPATARCAHYKRSTPPCLPPLTRQRKNTKKRTQLAFPPCNNTPNHCYC